MRGCPDRQAGPKLQFESATDAMVDVGCRPGRKLASLVHTFVAGGDHIDDVALLRAAATGWVLGHDTVAPSMSGTWRAAGAARVKAAGFPKTLNSFDFAFQRSPSA